MVKRNPPCLLHEDADLLVINKPAGLNTHAPAHYASEGIYDWLRHRHPDWAELAIVHRLDKGTSGVLVFGKTPQANRSLTQQFENRSIKKRYLFAATHPCPSPAFQQQSHLVRSGEKYLSRSSPSSSSQSAETHFRLLTSHPHYSIVEATPLTGRTHQIRVHAADAGVPILGDTLYGGRPARRLHLHASELTLAHPDTNHLVTFRAPLDFESHPALSLRAALLCPEQTNAFRLFHGASDQTPGWFLDRLGDFLLSQSEQPIGQGHLQEVQNCLEQFSSGGVYHKTWTRHVRQLAPGEASPKLLLGETAPPEVCIRENGAVFSLRFDEGYSTGLFLDQRDNRRRILTNHVGAHFPLFETGGAGRRVLNTFAYTCAFSACAAIVGAQVTSLDLSRKYLDWGKRNFTLNGLDPSSHDFIHGDAFDWLRRFAKKGRSFDLVLLDPPTFSQSKLKGAFRAEKDYASLAQEALAVLKPGGVLFASTNAARLEPERFLDQLTSAAAAKQRKILQHLYFPQPPDFPISREEPAYLKTVWLRIA